VLFRSWLRMTFMDPNGKVIDLWNIVERRAPEDPEVTIALVNNAANVRLHWEPIEDAIAYEVYRWPAGFAPPDGGAPWLTTTNTWAVDLVPPSGQWFYYVKTVYEQ
jgi:hypothetical protein